MYYTFINYDKTTALQLPPILPDRDRHYLPKSASFNSPSSCNNSLSNIILQQQYHHYNNINMKKKKRNKRLNTSISSSSLSSSNSMDDLLVVTPKNNDYNNKKHFHLNTSTSIMWLDPILPHHHGNIIFKN